VIYLFILKELYTFENSFLQNDVDLITIFEQAYCL